MKILNCTPHDINILGDNGSTITSIKPSGTIVRANQENKRVGYLNINGVAIPESAVTFNDNGLPDECDDTLLIVSKLTADAFPWRQDLLLVNESVRDEDGKVIGCKSLAFANK